jgi:hypothetical protein
MANKNRAPFQANPRSKFKRGLAGPSLTITMSVDVIPKVITYSYDRLEQVLRKLKANKCVK